MIPVLDCNGENPENLSKEILAAIETVGFVYLKNLPGLLNEEVDKVFATADKFWKLDLETKKKYKRPQNYENEGNTGYVGAGVEILDPTSKAEIREAYNITPHISEKMVFPDAEVPEFRTVTTEFFKKCHAVSLDIMRALAKALELDDPEYFTKNHHFIAKGTNATSLRVLHYPALPDDIGLGTVRCGVHSDYGTITLLFQDDIGGLEVMARDGSWIPAVPEPSGILVNAGDLLENWTTGRIKAVKHRVLVPEDRKLWAVERRSMTFFVHPDDECLVQPWNGSDKYQPITAKQHLINMFAITY